MKRTDPHSPKNIQPEDYQFVGTITWRTAVDDAGFSIADDTDWREVEAHMESTGGQYSDHAHGGSCHVCGAYALDFGIFYHAKTNEYIRAGRDCAAHIDSGLRSAFDATARKRRAAQARAANVEKVMPLLVELGIAEYVENAFADDDIGGAVRGYNVANPYDHDDPNDEDYDSDAADRFQLSKVFGDEIAQRFPLRDLNWYYGQHYILVDMVRKLVKYGSWSIGQQRFAKKIVEQIGEMAQKLFEREEARAALPDAPEGRIEVVGTVRSVKVQETDWGNTVKMLVEANDGWKVWGTVPSAAGIVRVGDAVQFVATLTRSRDDHSFAIAKRPSKFVKV